MKKVIFYNSNQVWGGGEKWHFNMAMALKNIGYTTELITNPGSELETKAKENKLKTYSLTTNNLSFLNLFKIIQLYKLLKEVKPDIIFLNLPSDVKMCAPIAKFAGVSKVVYRRGMPNPIRNTLLNKYFYSQVDLIIANSIEIKKTIMQNITKLESKIKIVYNGVTPKEIQTKSIREPLILGNLGRLVEQKGQLHLIQVAKLLKERNVSFILKIAGKGPLAPALTKEIQRLSLEKEVQLLGHVEAQAFFTDIDIFVFTSHFEGSANALIESLQHSTPAIAFDISSNPEVLKNNHSGFLISPFNEKEMADKIIELSTSNELYEKFQKNGNTTIKNKFDYSKKIIEIENIING